MENSPKQRVSNRGGGYLEDLEVVTNFGSHVLRLRAPAGAVKQICLTDPRYTVMKTLGRRELRGVGSRPTHATASLLDLLGRVLSLPCPDSVDYALALDWYKTPVGGVAPRDWQNTVAGDLVNRGKYWYSGNPMDVSELRECGRALVDLIGAVIDQHPLLAGVHAIVAVPGHDSKVLSFGARLADAVGRRFGKPLVRCTALAEFRTPAKNLDPVGRASVIDNQFVCHDDLTGLSLLIVDDIYRSGSTVAETARSARAAGAAHVASLCAVRTMRLS